MDEKGISDKKLRKEVTKVKEESVPKMKEYEEKFEIAGEAYLFAHNVWERLYELCDRLTDFPYNSSDARDVEDQLNAFLGKMDDIEFEGLLPGQHADLNEFYKVISSISDDLIEVVPNCSLRDMLASGYETPGLLDDIMQDVVPMDPNVGRIENDDTLKRI